MSIYGSLKAAVTGLKSQASSMAMISDNIANANTVGYKRNIADFETLVTQSGTSAYAPGGVRANSVALVDQQGLINASASTTDIALTGRGFFAVSTAVNDYGQVPAGTERLFTRAGSYRTNSEGFLTSASGEYLLGVPADSSGAVPQITLPVDQMRAINVGSITGSARATSKIAIGANLPATSKPPTNVYSVVLPSTATLPFAPIGGNHTFDIPGTRAAGAAGGAPASPGIIDPTLDPALTTRAQYTGNSVTFEANAGATAYDIYLNVGGPPPIAKVKLGSMTAAGSLNFQATVAGSTGAAPGTATGGQMTFKITGAVAQGPGPAAGAGAEATLTLDDQYRARMADATGTASSSTAAQFDLSSLTGTQAGFTTDVTVYDSLGVGHNIQLAYVKRAANSWDAYVTKMTIVGRTDASGNPIDSITGTSENSWVYNGTEAAAALDRDDTALGTGPALTAPSAELRGKLKANSRLGRLDFDTNGAMRNFVVNTRATFNSGDPTRGADLSSPLSTGATKLNPTFNLGTPGTKNGLTQQSDVFANSFINQDGVRFGYKTGVVIDKEGVVRAVFDNGQRLPVGRVGVVTFADPNRLDARTGNLYAQTDSSGSPTVNFAGIGGAGTIQSNALEGSTVDLSEEFTSMIVTQRSYSANAKTITTSDEMLQEIITLKR